MDLVNDPIPALIRKIAIPASVGLFFNTMYNIVDTFYAGMISTEALAALSLSFPVFFSLIAVGSGMAQGATALIANALGAEDERQASRYFEQSISFGILLGLTLTLVGWFAAPGLFRTLGASGEYLEICLAYMRVILVGTTFLLLQSIFNAALNAQGDTRTFRNVLIAGFLLNLALDPWFLWGGFGVPPMGIAGIGLATICIHFCGAAYILRRASKTPLWRAIHWRDFTPDAASFRAIAGQGFPASANMMTVALGVFVITWFISQFSREGVAAYGIATRIEQIVLLPTIGLNIAVLTLVGQNNGARRFDRVRQIWTKALQYGLTLMILAGALIWMGGRGLMGWFTEDAVVARAGAEYLNVAAITLCAYVVLFQTVFLLQGLKRPMYAIWIGVYRQLLAPALVFYLLAFHWDWGLKGIWWGIFWVNWSAAVITILYGRATLAQVAEGK